MIENVEEIERVFGDEKGLDRAVDFTSSFGPICEHSRQ